MVRNTFYLPRESHRYFLEELTEAPHVKILMASRLVKFHEMLLKSERPAINLIAKITENDCRTIHGSNMKHIANNCETTIENLSSYIVKESMKFCRVASEDEWKISVVKELIQTKNGMLNLSEFDNNDLTDMIKILTTS